MTFEIAPKSTEIQTNWYTAISYCFSLRIDGKSGWRLPTIEELNAIYQSGNDFEKWAYWSSTESEGFYVLYQNFYKGNQNDSIKSNGNFYVRAVRDIK